jgi:dephospho-CoA kinase
MLAADEVLTIALTGGIGSGKSTLARCLADQGAGLIDLDAIGRELTAPGGPGLEAIRAEFGDAIIERNGALDRSAIRARVFGDARARRRLEQLLHPLIWQRAELRAGELAAGADYLLFDIPLLAETGARLTRFDRVLLIDCPVASQLERVLQRGALQRSEVEAIVAAQASRESRLALADDVVFNGASLAALEQRAHRLHAHYRELGCRRKAV